MSNNPRVHAIEFIPVPYHLAERGLVCWTEFSYGCIRLHGVALRRTLKGDFALSFPRLHMRSQHIRSASRPINDGARISLQETIIAEAKRQGFIQ